MSLKYKLQWAAVFAVLAGGSVATVGWLYAGARGGVSYNCSVTNQQLQQLKQHYDVSVQPPNKVQIRLDSESQAGWIRQILGAEANARCKEQVNHGFLYIFNAPELS